MSGWSALSELYDTAGTEGVAILLVRGTAVALAGWLLLAAALQVLAAVPSLHLLRPLADLISPRSMQRLGRSLAGLSLTAGLAAPAPSAGTFAPHHGTLEAPAVAPADEPSTATMRVVDPAPPPTPPPPASWPERGTTEDTVTVASGDSFWSIAVDVLTEVTGRRPHDHEVAPYWHRLVDANRPNLVVPDNPDLLYPGQALELPPPA